MFSKSKNKKQGFTLIELIVVIATIAILAAIAIPAFGQISEKANKIADLANARTIYSVVTAAVAQDIASVPITGSTTYEVKVKETDADIDFQYWGLSTIPHTRSGNSFYVSIDNTGNVTIYDQTPDTDVRPIYPE